MCLSSRVLLGFWCRLLSSDHCQHFQLCFSILAVKSGQLLPVLASEHRCRVEMGHLFHPSPHCCICQCMWDQLHWTLTSTERETEVPHNWPRTWTVSWGWKPFPLHKVLWGHVWGLSATRRDTQYPPSLQISTDTQLKKGQSFLLHPLENSCVGPAHLP